MPGKRKHRKQRNDQRGFIIDSALLPEGVFDRSFKKHLPKTSREHLATEFFEMSGNSGDQFSRRELKNQAEEITIALRPSLRQRVLVKPKPVTKVVVN